MDHVTCWCGNTVWEAHNELTITLGAAVASKGRGLVPADTETQVIRCTECRQSLEDVVSGSL